jgi:hypothetical protein
MKRDAKERRENHSLSGVGDMNRAVLPNYVFISAAKETGNPVNEKIHFATYYISSKHPENRMRLREVNIIVETVAEKHAYKG